MNIRVRDFLPADENWVIQGLMAIHALESDETTLPPPMHFETQLRRWVSTLNNLPSALIIIAEYDEQARGFLIGEADTTPNPLSLWQKRAFIHALWVSPSYHRMGIGRKLVQTFEAAIAEYDIPYCDLAYHPKNTSAAHFWAALGYQQAQVTARKMLHVREN